VILLDTHCAVWLAVSPERLSIGAKRSIQETRQTGGKLALSVISLYEIAYIARRKRIQLHVEVRDFLGRLGAEFEIIPVNAAIAAQAAQFPEPFPSDPMDRLIAATALECGLVLITRDDRIHQSGVCRTLW
jgi:PIN domain nuclease of toxin-antitoxin system